MSHKIVGHYVSYFISPEATVDYRQLAQRIEDTGAFVPIPAKPKKVNLFRRVCAELASTGVPLKRLSNDTLHTSYRYGVDGEFRFDKKTGMIAYLGDHTERTDSLKVHMDEAIESLENTLYDQPLRIALMAALVEKLGAIPLKPSGGVYFILGDHTEDLERIVEVFQPASLYESGGASLMQVWVAPAYGKITDREAVTIQMSVEREIVQPVESLLSDLVDKVNSMEDDTPVSGSDIINVRSACANAIDSIDRYISELGSSSGLRSARKRVESMRLAVELALDSQEFTNNSEGVEL